MIVDEINFNVRANQTTLNSIYMLHVCSLSSKLDLPDLIELI